MGAPSRREVAFVHAGPDGVAEVARHQVAAPGSPRVEDAHYPPAPPGPLGRKPKARTAAEAEFVAIGDGARMRLAEPAASVASRVRAKMAEAVQLTRLCDAAAVDRALGETAAAGRFGQGDLTATLAHQATAGAGPVIWPSEAATLARGTTSWAGFATPEVTA